MSKILHVAASPRVDRSISRRMSQTFLNAWRDLHRDDEVIVRDVGLYPPPFVSEAWIAACFTAPERRTAAMQEVLRYSDECIAELESADFILISTPMYNYGMPSALKAWFDMVIRVNKTFTFDGNEKTWPLSPILKGKTLIVLSSRGEFGFEVGGIRETWNHLDSHIRTCAHYIGAAQDHIFQISTDYQEFGDERHDRSKQDADLSIYALVGELGATVD